MYSNFWYPRAFRFTAKNRLLITPHESRSRPSISVGQDSLQVPFDRPGRSSHRLEQLPRLFPHRPHPRVPVAELLPNLLGILPLVDVLKHRPHLETDARYATLQDHQLPLTGFLFRPGTGILSHIQRVRSNRSRVPASAGLSAFWTWSQASMTL
jgi:hypothetical protein